MFAGVHNTHFAICIVPNTWFSSQYVISGIYWLIWNASLPSILYFNLFLMMLLLLLLLFLLFVNFGWVHAAAACERFFVYFQMNWIFSLLIERMCECWLTWNLTVFNIAQYWIYFIFFRLTRFVCRFTIHIGFNLRYSSIVEVSGMFQCLSQHCCCCNRMKKWEISFAYYFSIKIFFVFFLSHMYSYKQWTTHYVTLKSTFVMLVWWRIYIATLSCNHIRKWI